jgi:hemoglobin/transferrin/lactoferrin receptor protein
MQTPFSAGSFQSQRQCRAIRALARWITLPGLLLLTAATTSVIAQAQSNGTQAFDIPRQRLLSALDRFGEQTGLQVAAGADDVNGMLTQGVRGDYTPQQALDVLLAGSGLDARVDDGVAIILTQARQGPVMAQASSTASEPRSSPDSARRFDDTAQTPAAIESIVVVGEATNALIAADDLEVYQAKDLADIFRLTPSIAVGGGASSIAQKIYVRGLEDSLINVSVDGAPQTSTLFHHIGRVTIDPDLLKQIEVQAGAGEATSGAGAIGGSIRFRTKDADDLLSADRSIGGRLKVSSYSNDGERYSGSLYGRLSDSWGVLAYYSDIERDDVEDGNGVEMDGTAARQTLGFFKVSGDIGDNQQLSLSYESREEQGQFTRWPNWSPLEDAPLYAGEGQRDTVVGNYRLQQSPALDLEATVFHTQSGFQRELFSYNAEISSFGFDIRNTSVAGIHRFTYGIDMRDDEVESGEIGTVQYLEEGRVTGLYAQSHSQLTGALLLSFGARYDDYGFNQLMLNDTGMPLAEIDSSDISLNAGLAYDLTEEWTFSLGYAEAFRGLEITDGFTNWGTAVAPDLDAETVANVEAALEYRGRNFAAKFALFQSDIDDVIFDQSGGPVLYENLGRVETDGFEMDFTYRWDSVEFYLGFASSDAVLDSAEGVFSVDYGRIDLEGYEFTGLGNTRGDTWNLGVSAAPMRNLRLGWNIASVEDLNDLQVLQRSVELGWIADLQYIDKPGYTVHDVYAEWTPLENLRLNLAVSNVFDEHYRDHSSIGDYTAIPGWEAVSGYNEPGRDIRLSASLSF